MSYYNDLNLLELDDLRECLNYIDASDRDTWLNVCWGLSKSYNTREDVKQIFKAWARTSSIRDENKDSKHEDKEWLKAQTQSKYTLGTVIHLAQMKGYELPKKPKNNSKQNLDINISNTLIKSSVNNSFVKNELKNNQRGEILNDIKEISSKILQKLVYFSSVEELGEYLSKFKDCNKSFIDFDYIIFNCLLNYKKAYSNYDVQSFSLFCEKILKEKKYINEDAKCIDELEKRYLKEELPIDGYNLENAFNHLTFKHKELITHDLSKSICDKALDLGSYNYSFNEPKEDTKNTFILNVLNDLQALLNNNTKFQEYKSSEDTPFKELKERFKDYQDPIKMQHAFLKTGFDFDNSITGLRRGDINILAAHTGVGKTFISEQIQLNLCLQGYKTLFLSLEMSNTDIFERAFCIHNKVSKIDIIERTFNIDKKLKEFENTIKNSKGSFDIIYQGDMTEIEIENHIKRFKYTYGLDFVVIDYLQKINYSQSKGEGEIRWFELKKVMEILTNLATEYDISILAIAQLKREERVVVNTKKKTEEEEQTTVEKKLVKPTVYDIAGSSGVTTDAANIFLMYRTGESVYEISLEKTRHGSNGFKSFVLSRLNGGAFIEDYKLHKKIKFKGNCLIAEDKKTTQPTERKKKKENYDLNVIIAKDKEEA